MISKATEGVKIVLFDLTLILLGLNPNGLKVYYACKKC